MAGTALRQLNHWLFLFPFSQYNPKYLGFILILVKNTAESSELFIK